MTPPGQNVSQAVLSHSCTRNQSVESIESFRSFPDRLKDFLYYRHCRHFPMLLDLPDKCGGSDRSSDVFLLLVIKIPPNNYERREMLRKTWALERKQNGVQIRRVFIIGTMGSGFEKERLNKVLDLEQSQYKDILQWDIADTFQNLTLKQVLFLEWMERNCPKVRFLFNGDDDVFVNTNNVVKFLQNLKDNDGSKHLFTGNVRIGLPPFRTECKYYVPIQVYRPKVYPPFCSGAGFLLTGHTASVIYNMSQSISLIPVDDVYIGLCLAKAGLSVSSHAGVRVADVHFDSKRVNDYDPCFYKELLLVHGFFSEKMYYLWHLVNDPNLKCFGNDK
ncbi:N-acetyllactosaminide beta-1,3-N-acetylglucosaminyltransferase 3-like [Halichoeres trimaculatus]|uniref:N-acetyllactosaminide beta-1,3-N-acetylglucosaminyltransferase 3-like n=1 Tax=Halichoeres trimaculatus TaxID=147232 RepID=UPI003D9ED6E9